MPAHMGLAVDVHRAQGQLRRLERAKRPFHPGETLVSLHRLRGPDLGGRQAGANDVDAIQLSLRVDLLLVPGPADVVVSHLDPKVLGDLLAVHVPTHPAVDRLLAAQPRSRGAHGAGDRLQDLFGRAEQFLPLAGAVLAQAGIEADQQAFSGKFRAEDLRDPVRNQLARPQRSRLIPFSARFGRPHQLADGVGSQGRDPGQSGR